MKSIKLTVLEIEIIISALKNFKIDLKATASMNFSADTTQVAYNNIEQCDCLLGKLNNVL